MKNSSALLVYKKIKCLGDLSIMSERTNQDFYYDFKLSKPFVLHGLCKNILYRKQLYS